MSGVDTREDLVPLRTDFDRSWRGYDTRQVREYVQRVEADLRLLSSDRDAAAVSVEGLAQQLEALRCENDRLRAKIDRPFDVKLIHTVRGIGYVCEVRECAAPATAP